MSDDEEYEFQYDGDDDVADEGGAGVGATAQPDSMFAVANGRRSLGVCSAASGPTDEKRGKPQSSYVAITVDDLLTRVSALVGDVKEVVCCSEDEALLLLYAFRFDKRRLEESIWDEGLRDKLGISTAPDPPPLPAGCGPADTFTCAVGMEETSYAQADACACGHWFSDAALRGHCEAAMDAASAALSLRCPASAEGCRECVRPRLFRKYLSLEGFAKYQGFIGRSLADTASNARYCPLPRCDSVVTSDLAVAADVLCSHGHRFCFGCRGSAHRPASCDEATRWQRKEAAEGSNAQWLVAHTKPCPTCARAIEKNQGCNHMVCRRPGGCGAEFCWVCLGPWTDHRDYFHCNRPPGKAGAGEDAAKRSAQELAVYAFYSTRYGEALRSGKHAEGTRDRVAAFQRQLQEELGASAGKFMSRALDVVTRGRNVAAWSYVHAFFVADPAYKTLLEDSQGLMERNLEQLHGNLELSAITRVLSGDDADAKTPSSYSSSSSSSSSSKSAAGSAALYASSSRTAGAGAGARGIAMVQRRFTEWRQRTMMLLAATDRFVDGLLEAVEEGLLEDGRGYDTADVGAGASAADAVVAGGSGAVAQAVVADSGAVEGSGAGTASQEGAGDGPGGATRHASSLRSGAGSRRTRSQAAAEAAGSLTTGGSAASGKRTRFADTDDT